MVVRRVVATLLFVGVLASSLEVLWADGFEGLRSDHPEFVDGATDRMVVGDADDHQDDGCPCLCACACAGALSVVVPSPVTFQFAVLDISSPALLQESTPVSSFIERHLRPPLA